MLRILLISPILSLVLLSFAVCVADESNPAESDSKKIESIERKLRVARILRDLKTYNEAESESSHQVRADIVMVKASPEVLEARNFQVGDQSLAQYLLSLANVSNQPDQATGVLKDSTSVIEAFRSAKQADALTQLATPSIITFSGRAAEFQSIGKIARPIKKERGEFGVEFFDVGSTVKLTPTYEDDGQIRLEVEGRFAEVDFAEKLAVGLPPKILERSVTSSAKLRSGETMFLARRVQSTSGVQPTAGVEPPAGPETESDARIEFDLILLVTPKLVK